MEAVDASSLLPVVVQPVFTGLGAKESAWQSYLIFDVPMGSPPSIYLDRNIDISPLHQSALKN